MSLTVLCYHSIEENPRIYGVTPEKFKKQVEFISSNYTVLPITEAFEKFRDSSLPDDAVVFTFDDGLRTALNAADILESNDVLGTFYIISGLLGEFHEGQKVLEPGEVKELNDRGHEIGSHTVSHPHLTHYSEEHIRNELVESKKNLENLIEEEITSFSYPYGEYNETAVAVAKETGYQHAVTTELSSVKGSEDNLKIPRHVVFNWHDTRDIERMIQGNDSLKRAYWKYPVRNRSRLLRKIKGSLM